MAIELKWCAHFGCTRPPTWRCVMCPYEACFKPAHRRHDHLPTHDAERNGVQEYEGVQPRHRTLL